MWKKDETPKAPPARSEKSSPAAPTTRASGKSVIGQSLRIDGTVTGSEDLLVQGKIDGEVKLAENTVTIGTDGHVKATVKARIIIVEGTVEGDLHGGEQVEILQSGNVQGNIVSPRVGLEDGAQFKGNIDMSPATSPSRPASTPKPEPKPNDKAVQSNDTTSGSPSNTKLSG